MLTLERKDQITAQKLFQLQKAPLNSISISMCCSLKDQNDKIKVEWSQQGDLEFVDKKLNNLPFVEIIGISLPYLQLV